MKNINIEKLLEEANAKINEGMIIRDAIYAVASNREELAALSKIYSKAMASAEWAD